MEIREKIMDIAQERIFRAVELNGLPQIVKEVLDSSSVFRSALWGRFASQEGDR